MKYAQIGQHMMNKASTECHEITDDAYFNSLCRVGEALTYIGQPFEVRSFDELPKEYREFTAQYAKEFLVNASK